MGSTGGGGSGAGTTLPLVLLPTRSETGGLDLGECRAKRRSVDRALWFLALFVVLMTVTLTRVWGNLEEVFIFSNNIGK